MASIKNSLRKIYTALGGTNTKSKTITGLLDDISTVASSGGGGESSPITYLVFEYDNISNMYSTDQMTHEELLQKTSNGSVYVVLKSGYDYRDHVSIIPVQMFANNTGSPIGLGFYVFRTWSSGSNSSGISCDLYIIGDDMSMSGTAYSQKKLQFIS